MKTIDDIARELGSHWATSHLSWSKRCELARVIRRAQLTPTFSRRNPTELEATYNVDRERRRQEAA